MSEKLLVLDRGNVALTIPSDWSIQRDPAGFMRLEDGTEECLLEVSYMEVPPLGPDAPPVEERLKVVMDQSKVAEAPPAIAVIAREDLRAAWADYPYESDDPKRGIRRPARGRWLVGANDRFQILMTFYYWADDTAWAVRAWERIVEMVRPGDGTQMRRPFGAWSVEDLN